MIELRRTVRFSVSPGGHAHTPAASGYGGNPAPRGLARHVELDVACAGDADPRCGYIVNIKTIDHAVRDGALPLIARACDEQPHADPATLLPAIIAAVAQRLPVPLRSVRWHASPYASFEMRSDQPASVVIRQRYELAASHRLHVDEWTDEANRAAFGKCNNPSGHGHNYIVEPEVRAALKPTGPSLDRATLDRAVHSTILDPFDHMYLNEVPPFAPARGEPAINPSVENIARVFHDRLRDALRDAAPDAELLRLCVWETDRTSATYPA